MCQKVLLLFLCWALTVSALSSSDCFNVYYNSDDLIPDSNYLSLEYVRRSGVALIERVAEKHYTTDQLTHINGFLSEIPNNLCDFVDIVSIVLEQNKIKSLGNLSCLQNLKILKLKRNALTTVRNDSFIGLNLTILDLSENIINMMEPNVFSANSFQITLADISRNHLSVVDVTNFVLDYPYCKIDYSNNMITEIVNPRNLLLENATYGDGGYVNLKFNQFEDFMDFEKLGVPDIRLIGKLYGFGFDLRGSRLNCNAIMVPFLELSEFVIRRIWRDIFDIRCWEPVSLRNQSIPQLVLDKKLDLFVTEVSRKDNCPYRCTCIDQPSQRKIIVNCTNKNLSQFPNVLPDGKNVELLISGNDIHVLEAKSYLDRIVSLDLSNNSIESIDTGAPNLLRNTKITVRNNKKILRQYSRELQILNPCRITIGDYFVFQCDCDRLWLKDWIDNSGFDICHANSSIICSTTRGMISARQLSEDILGCEVDTPISLTMSILFGLFSLLLIVLFFLVYQCHYELLLLKRKFYTKEKKNKYSMKVNRIYISFDSSYKSALSYVVKELEPELMRAGYDIFIPSRDIEPGTIEKEQISKDIAVSKNFIVILSKEYSTSEHTTTNLEWKCIWSVYSDNSEVNIVFVNFDHLRARHVHSRSLKAVFRLGLPLDFTNRQKTIYAEILTALRLSDANFSKPSLIRSNKRETVDSNISLKQVNSIAQTVHCEFDDIHVDLTNTREPYIEQTYL